MHDWIIITPEGITKSPNNIIYENFQVLGFVFASTKETVLRKLKENYPYLNRSDFDEVWIYQLGSKNPHVTYLGIEDADDEIEDKVKSKL